MEDKLLVDCAEAARRLSCGRSFFYRRLIQTGLLRSYKIAGARRVRVEDLEAFVRNLRDENDGGIA